MAKILVLDDAVSTLQWIAQILARVGHDVTTSESGKVGVELLQTTAVDLLITDIYMPDEDGLEVIQKARRLAPTVKIIAISAKPAKRNMFAAAQALGATRTLQKPFSEEELLQAVSGVLPPDLAAGAAPPQLESIP